MNLSTGRNCSRCSCFFFLCRWKMSLTSNFFIALLILSIFVSYYFFALSMLFGLPFSVQDTKKLS